MIYSDNSDNDSSVGEPDAELQVDEEEDVAEPEEYQDPDPDKTLPWSPVREDSSGSSQNETGAAMYAYDYSEVDRSAFRSTCAVKGAPFCLPCFMLSIIFMST